MRIIREGNLKTIHAGLRSYPKENADYIKKNNIPVFGAGETEFENFLSYLRRLRNGDVYVSFDYDRLRPVNYALCRHSRTGKACYSAMFAEFLNS